VLQHVHMKVDNQRRACGGGHGVQSRQGVTASVDAGNFQPRSGAMVCST
jgi:hypothetical protein